RQLVTHLGAVPVHQHDPPAVSGQVDHRREALARVAELIRDRGALARRGDGIPPPRHAGRAWAHGAATYRGPRGRRAVPTPRPTSAAPDTGAPPPSHSRGTPGAVCGDPSTEPGRRVAWLGRHSASRGPAAAIVPASRPATSPRGPASNPSAIHNRVAPAPPATGLGATRSNGSRGRGVQDTVSERERVTCAAAVRNARRGYGSWPRRLGGRPSSGRTSGA